MYKKGDLLRVSILGDAKDAEAIEDSLNETTRVKITYNDVLKKTPQSISLTMDNKLISKRQIMIPDKEKIKKLKKEVNKYKKGFNVLMEYYNSIYEDEQPLVDKKLKKIGL